MSQKKLILTFCLIFVTIKSAESEDFACGPPSEAIGTIYDGSHNPKNFFPWSVGIANKSEDLFCGGVLISSNKILTAAHCLEPKDAKIKYEAKDISLFLGFHYLYTFSVVGTLILTPEKINLHPKWNRTSLKYDIAVLTLADTDKITFIQTIRPICLDFSPEIHDIKTGTVLGYGFSEQTGFVFELAAKVIDLPIHDNDDCFERFASLKNIGNAQTFCAGHANGTDTCAVDSGSGLAVFHKGSYYLRGIVSSRLFDADGKCDPNVYSLMTDVSFYQEFIESI